MNQNSAIHQYMTSKVATIREDRNVEDAFRVVEERNFRHLPVVNSSGKLVGILSTRDLSNLKMAMDIYGVLDKNYQGMQSLKMSDLMQTNLVTALPDDTISMAAELMLKNEVGAILVVNPADREKIEGILSYVDVLRALSGQLA